MLNEHLQDGRFQYHPADAYTDEGELRVYTQPLVGGASSDRRTRDMVRHAVHDVVTVRLASCMEPWERGENGEMHTAVVIHQHHDADRVTFVSSTILRRPCVACTRISLPSHLTPTRTRA